jgi:hypothetical protein
VESQLDKSQDLEELKWRTMAGCPQIVGSIRNPTAYQSANQSQSSQRFKEKTVRK